MASCYRFPDEIILAPVLQSFPGREHQIRALATLFHPDAARCRSLVVYGTEATGKSAVTEKLLVRLARPMGGQDAHVETLRFAIINSTQCITARHLFETIVRAVSNGLGHHDKNGRARRPPHRRFVLVLDAIDRQRDAPPTLLPALARLSEMIPCLTCVFIITCPPAGVLRAQTSAHLHFPPYTKPEFVRIQSLTPPDPIPGTTQQETAEVWTRFCASVHDALVRSATRTLSSFQCSCRTLWPQFTAPVTAGTHAVREFSKLLVAARVHFQDESLPNPSIVSSHPDSGSKPKTTPMVSGLTKLAQPATNAGAAELTGLLPIDARLLLLSAYLASHNATRNDRTLFSTYHHGRRRRRGGGFVTAVGVYRRTARKHRKIARKLLGAHAFVLERMLAIFEAVRGEWAPEDNIGVAGLDGDVGMAIATLASLRLLVRVGSGDVTDRAGKWRINASWEAVRSIGRSMGVEVEDWLIE
ncbi:hypothetical protein CDD83_5129 [Cordyceps sp. RAO-2017]|nr:hypothetical protein CDD83_5129 [Cordyceps sp. RAO-2017]